MALVAVAEEVQIDVPKLPPHRQIDSLEKVDVANT